MGFYVFENVISQELQDLEIGVTSILDRSNMNFDLNKLENCIGLNCKAPTLFWSKPLADPFGGTSLANGRHPVKMNEPLPEGNVPDEVVYLILGTLQFSEELLRTYAHPDLLKVAEAINGEDFVPFTEALFIKEPGLGHQWRGIAMVLHRDSPDFDEGTRV